MFRELLKLFSIFYAIQYILYRNNTSIEIPLLFAETIEQMRWNDHEQKIMKHECGNFSWDILFHCSYNSWKNEKPCRVVVSFPTPFGLEGVYHTTNFPRFSALKTQNYVYCFTFEEFGIRWRNHEYFVKYVSIQGLVFMRISRVMDLTTENWNSFNWRLYIYSTKPS